MQTLARISCQPVAGCRSRRKEPIPVLARETRRRWESNNRYFEVRIQTDLFGQRILTVANGGIGNRLGNIRVVAVDGDIDLAVHQLGRRRLAHNYVEVAVPN
jgi:hypothetical protein